MLLTFRGPCPPGKESGHLDDNPKNNWLANLFYGTHSQNEHDKTRNGGRPVVTRCINGHEYNVANTQVTSQGKKCLRCRSNRARAKYRIDAAYRSRQIERHHRRGSIRPSLPLPFRWTTERETRLFTRCFISILNPEESGLKPGQLT